MATQQTSSGAFPGLVLGLVTAPFVPLEIAASIVSLCLKTVPAVILDSLFNQVGFLGDLIMFTLA